jgi:MoxR-like ATPase
MVVATQNPLEHEGTYPLPEAQLDRFMMRVEVGYPDRTKELEMLETHAVRSTYHDLTPVVHADDVLAMVDIARSIHVDPSVKGYIIDVVGATRGHGEVLLGGSPRSSLFLQRAARAHAAVDRRDYVTPDDVKAVALPILEHRMALRPEANMRGLRLREVIDSILKSLRVPSATRLA